MTLTSDNVEPFNGQIPRQNAPRGGLPLGSFERVDVRREVQAKSFTTSQDVRNENDSSAMDDSESMDVGEDEAPGNEAHWHGQENCDEDDDYYDDDFNEDEGEDDMEADDYRENDFSLMEGPKDDVEMLNVRRKFKADTDELYSRRHHELSIGEYRDDIYRYSREIEVLCQPRAEYMRKQLEINHNLRSTLVDWMADVVLYLNLKRETFFLSVNFMDRYMSVKCVPKSMLQAIGLTCLFLAGKFEEGEPPSLRSFARDSEARQIRNMEMNFLRIFDFRTNVPTANFFCLDLLNQFSLEEIEYAMTLYILETTLVYGDKFLNFLPSLLATSCFLFTHLLLKGDHQKELMDKVTSLTGYEFRHLHPCIKVILEVMQNLSEKFKNIKEKYLSERYCSVSNVVLPKDLTFERFIAGDFQI